MWPSFLTVAQRWGFNCTKGFIYRCLPVPVHKWKRVWQPAHVAFTASLLCLASVTNGSLHPCRHVWPACIYALTLRWENEYVSSSYRTDIAKPAIKTPESGPSESPLSSFCSTLSSNAKSNFWLNALPLLHFENSLPSCNVFLSPRAYGVLMRMRWRLREPSLVLLRLRGEEPERHEAVRPCHGLTD